MNSGVEIVLARMATHPEEFYGDSDKWKFIYKEYFRDAMTETEKGAIFDRIKEIRKEEFTLHVMKAITNEEHTEEYEHERNNPAFGSAPIKREGSKVMYYKTITNKGTEVTEDSFGRIFINGVLVK